MPKREANRVVCLSVQFLSMPTAHSAQHRRRNTRLPYYNHISTSSDPSEAIIVGLFVGIPGKYIAAGLFVEEQLTNLPGRFILSKRVCQSTRVLSV